MHVDSAWVMQPRKVESALPVRQRLFCLPFAGGAATAFRAWQTGVPADLTILPVQLPGRENRLGEPALTSVPDLVAALEAALSPFLTVPFGLFGHSFGALLAFELTRELARRGRRAPLLLAVSGHRAPHLPPRRAPLHALDDNALVAELRRLNGTPPEVLAHRELLELLLPAMRADYTASETYRHEAGEPLECPIVALGGSADPDVAPHELAAWRLHTRSRFSYQLYEGDHFFIDRARPDIQALLANALAIDGHPEPGT